MKDQGKTSAGLAAQGGTVLETARRLHSFGANVVAIGKVPGDLRGKAVLHKWTPWQTLLQTDQDVEGLPWQKAWGVGIIQGPGDYRSLDIDKCTDEKVVGTILRIMHLPSDYKWASRTGSGMGFHIDFLNAEEFPADQLGEPDEKQGAVKSFPSKHNDFDHIELRWERCQTIMPPSYHMVADGYYEWLNGEPDEPPAVVALHDVIMALAEVANLQAAKETKKTVDVAVITSDQIVFAAGGRNNGLASLAGKLRHDGFSEPAIEAALLEENQHRCDPPLPDDEVRAIAHSIGKKRAGVVMNNHTDTGNAKRFVEQHGGTVLYCEAWKQWVTWNGRYWDTESVAEVYRKADLTVESIHDEVYLVLGNSKEADKKRKAILEHAMRSESMSRIQAMLQAAQHRDGIPATPDQFDDKKDLLNLLNGTYNLATGEFRGHESTDMLTKIAPVSYDPEAECPLWLQFLNDIMGGQQDMIDFQQRMLGYCLTGYTSEQSLFIGYGVGSNGKSTLIETMMAVLGTYARRANPTLLIQKDNTSEANYDLARLKGARFVACRETDDGKRLAESLVKQLTGDEGITARQLYQNFTEYIPEFKIFLATNHKPEVRGTDKGIWRRIKLIPFNVIIPDEKQDKQLQRKLRAELPGILNWLIEGARIWYKQGLGVPSEVQSATQKYQSDSDILAEFINTCCVVTPIAKVTSGDLYRAYTAFCDGERPMAQRTLTMKLCERPGISKMTGGGKKRMLSGIGLLRKAEESTDTGDEDVETEDQDDVDEAVRRESEAYFGGQVS